MLSDLWTEVPTHMYPPLPKFWVAVSTPQVRNVESYNERYHWNHLVHKLYMHELECKYRRHTDIEEGVCFSISNNI